MICDGDDKTSNNCDTISNIVSKNSNNYTNSNPNTTISVNRTGGCTSHNLLSPCPVATLPPSTPITPFIQFCELSTSRAESDGERTPMASCKLSSGVVKKINIREVV
uniref:Uncharacterized protein n=1 Tax=Lygus hesperus TaxID=30085 RepID=A0A146LNR7_LYGHE